MLSIQLCQLGLVDFDQFFDFRDHRNGQIVARTIRTLLLTDLIVSRVGSLLLPQIADPTGLIGIFPRLVSLRGNRARFHQLWKNGLGRVLCVAPVLE